MPDSESCNPLDGVAIIGMAGRFPGAACIDAFWSNLQRGVESISRFSSGQMEPSTPEEMASRQDPNYVKVRGVLENIELFDAAFFAMNPREATVTDPQQRLFLEASWEALENAGYDPERYAGSIGVYAGMSNNTYYLNHIHGKSELIRSVGALQVMMANEKDYLATRVSYKLNLRGPSLNIYTACSTSLVAVCQAFLGLTAYQCDMALAGGVSIMLPQRRGYLYQEGAITSRDGHCRPFDAEAAGTVFGNGLGVVVLKRLQDAMDDNDTIHGVIKGVGVNNDGSKRVSFSAPSVDGQAEVISMAQALAGIDPETISYVEAHGTATPLGDPIEIAGLTQAFRMGTNAKGCCAIGSVKSNIGHLDAAAGIAGLIKTVLALKFKQLPASLHFSTPNPKLGLESSPFYVNTALRDWEQGPTPRRAGVSSFGVGGTNSHAVLEEAPETPASSPARPAELLVLSARTPAALLEASTNLAAHLETKEDLNLGDVAFTLQTGRRHFACRRSVVAPDRNEAIRQLRVAPSKGTSASLQDRRDPPVAFLFPGQGVQYVNMGRELYETSACVRRAVGDCCDILREPLGLELRRVLYPARGEEEEAQRQLRETWITQPALFVVEYALAQLWMSHGVRPQAMLGHSVGEYVAACLAGVLTLADGLGLLAARARMMQDLPSGAMLAVRLPETELMAMLPGGLSLAAVNSPVLCVVSGPTSLVDDWQMQLKDRGVATKKLGTSHAFHSAMMDPIAEPFIELVRRTPRRPAQVPYLSNVTSSWITARDIEDPGYWFQHLRQPVRFADGISELFREGGRVLLEVGPQQTLSTLARQHPGRTAGQGVVASMPVAPDQCEWESWLLAVSQLWSMGQTIDWGPLHEGSRRRRVPLPTYPFERKRFWLEPSLPVNDQSGSADAPQQLEESVLVTRQPAAEPPASDPIMTTSCSSSDRRSRLVSEVRALIAELSGQSEADLASDASFLELGLDSLFLTQASQALQMRFGVKIVFRQLAGDLSSIDALANHLDGELPPEALPVEEVVNPAATAPSQPRPTALPDSGSPVTGTPGGQEGSGSLLERVIDQQMALMRRHLELIHGGQAGVEHGAFDSASVVKSSRHVGEEDLKRFGPFKAVEVGPKGGLTPRQEKALAELVERYNRRTRASKQYAQLHRDHFCDPRAAGNFRHLWKEMVYPIVCARSEGGRIWDIDGNEYVDVTLGFGANYFGHRPHFVVRAVEEQLGKGFEIGPQSPLAGDVARMLCELTGMERATFCNTGSEAVMAAIRVARTVTGRDCIVYFTGDYHGIFDEVLGHAATVGGRPGALPIAPGIPPLPNILVLEYGAEASLEIIRERASEIAAVLVEPVQSRHPDKQPREFLHALRQLTEEQDIALVFDEIVTGFRMAPGGAQEYFGVMADLATYGKVIGGGMPMGVLAGKRRYMDALDGGAWNFGDDSHPKVGVTFFAGTFVRHPLAMAAAHATLCHLRSAGPELQRRTTARTVKLVERLNDTFDQVRVPIRFQTFSSVFYYDFHPGLKYAGLLFYLLRDRGIHIWEGRVAQICTAHTDEDLNRIVRAFQESVQEMQAGGFLPEPTDSSGEGEAAKARLSGDLPCHEGATSERRIGLSGAQRELWLGAQMQPQAAGPHHASTGLWLKGPLQVEALRCAMALVLDRHESLRSTFNADGTEVIVHPADRPEQVSIEDWSSLPEAERESRVQCILEEEGHRLFDLERGPLATFRLLRLEPQRHLLVFTVQMIICDGWSHYAVFEDLAAAYSSLAAGREPTLKPALSMAEFAHWERGHATSDEARDCEAFWLAEFKNVPKPLDLPTSRPRPPTRTFLGSRYSSTLDKELCLEIRRVGREQRCSYFAVMLSAFEVLLYRLSGCRDLVVGVPFATQSPLGIDRLVGQCTNTLPLRSSIDPEETYASLLARTWARVLDANEHWNFTFGQVVSRLNLPPDPSRIPLVSVLFNLDPAMSLVKFEGIEHRFFNMPRYYFQYDLGLNVVEEEEGNIRVECDYSTNLFDADVITAWVAAYAGLLQAIVHDIHQPLSRLPMVSPTESEKGLLVGSGMDVQPAVHRLSLQEMVVAQAERDPEAIAVEDDSRRLSYRELEHDAKRAAEQLGKRGVKPGDRVGVLLERSVRLPVALLGILKAGAAYVALDPGSPRTRMTRILGGSGLRLVLADVATEVPLPSGKVAILSMDELMKGRLRSIRRRSEAGALRMGSDAIACVLQTSAPDEELRSIEISHASIVDRLQALREMPGFSAQDVMLGLSPATGFPFAIEVWLPLTTGARVAFGSPTMALDPAAVAAAIERHRVTVLQATPSIWGLLAQGGWAGSPRLRAWSGGETLGLGVAKRLLQLCGEVWNLFGSTETMGWCMASRVEPGLPVSLGRPVPGTLVCLVDKELQPVPVGVPGEILIGGAALVGGCTNDPNQQISTFVSVSLGDGRVERMFRTGDRARRWPGGRIEHRGRAARLIEVRGVRVDLTDIEAALTEHEAVQQALVLVRERIPGAKVLVAYVVLAGRMANTAPLRSHLRERLPAYMVPSELRLLDQFPVTCNHKTDLVRLHEIDAAPAACEERQLDEGVAFVAARTPTEKALAGIWRQVLRIEKPGIHDNFFHLGGHSMLAMRAVMLASSVGLALKPRSIFQHPTIAGLAAVTDGPGKSQAEDKRSVESPTGPLPLTPAQLRFLHERETRDPFHWNCSILLTAGKLEPGSIQRSLECLLAHHDALRLRLSKRDGEWTQVVEETAGPIAFDSHDLGSLGPDMQRARMEEIVVRLQVSLNLITGPVIRVAHFACGPDQPDRLFFTMHHFVMDVLSWEILWEDFESAYRQSLKGLPVELPPKTTPFRGWALRLRDLARSAAMRDAARRWLQLPWDQVAPLPMDIAPVPGANTNASATCCELLLSPEESSAILRAESRSRPEEIMLVALAQTLGEWSGARVTLIESLSHGRGIVEDADLSRTIGFMLFYEPFLVRLVDGTDPGAVLRATIGQIRSLPGGFTFDLLRFFSEDAEIRNALARLPRSEVLFNFMGEEQGLAVSEESSRFWRCDDVPGSDYGPQNGRYYPLAVSASVVRDGLRFRFVYSRNLHRQTTIQKLAARYRERLMELANTLAESRYALRASSAAQTGYSTA